MSSRIQVPASLVPSSVLHSTWFTAVLPSGSGVIFSETLSRTIQFKVAAPIAVSPGFVPFSGHHSCSAVIQFTCSACPFAASLETRGRVPPHHAPPPGPRRVHGAQGCLPSELMAPHGGAGKHTWAWPSQARSWRWAREQGVRLAARWWPVGSEDPAGGW